jgi:predicted permease
MVLRTVRDAFRALRASRGISWLVIAALALGMGANTAIFTITHALLLRSLPVKDPAHLINVQVGNFMSWGYIEMDNSFTWALWGEFTRQQDVMRDVFGYAESRFDAVLNGQTKPTMSAFVTGPMFQSLGLEPVIGRVFEDAPPGDPAAGAHALISYALWSREFATDPGVIGRTFVLEGKPFVIEGVLPSRFYGLTAGHAIDVYLPLAADPYIRGDDSALKNGVRYFIQGFGRLRPGITMEQAQKRLAALATLSMRTTLPSELPQRVHPDYLRQSFTLVPAAAGVSYLRENLEFPLKVLAGITALLLLLTCFTVANLMLARATVRQKELGVRIALGAGRAGIVRQLLLESVILACAGALLGIVVARVTAAYLVRTYSVASDPLMLDLSPDWGIFAFALAIALLSAVIFGLVPAVRASHIAPADALRTGRATASASVLRLRRLLLAGQIAVSVVLVTGAVLFGSSLRALLRVETGFQSDRVLIADLDVHRAHLEPGARRDLYLGVLEKVQRMPVVEAAALSYVTPISGSTWQFNVKAETPSGWNDVHVYYNGVSADFFKTFGTRILAGRGFSPSDTTGSTPVALVNATLARAAFGTTDVIGRRMSMLDPQRITVEIVGVVQDAKYRSLRQAVPPTLYGAMPQNAETPVGVSIAIRTRGTAPGPILRELGTMLTRDYPDMSFQLTTFSAQISDSIARDRAFALLCGIFAVLALALAAIGIYGVLSYFIAQRQAEIGIRMALGATPAAVRRLIYRQSFSTCAAGLVAGSLLAFWAGRYAKVLLYGVTPRDAQVYAAAAALIAAVAALATGIPALRAARTDSMQALRAE